MKIGILGGTLDPVHNGHIEIATAAMAALGLERVALMPSGDPPHKNRATSKWDRLRMAELAAEAHPGLYASDREIRREGTTYTVDTLSALVVEQPDVEWTYILGADAVKIEMLTAGDDGLRHLMHLGSSKDELYVWRRLLHSFEQRIESAGGEHMNLVDYIDLVFAHFGGISHALAQLADIVHP